MGQTFGYLRSQMYLACYTLPLSDMFRIVWRVTGCVQSQALLTFIIELTAIAHF